MVVLLRLGAGAPILLCRTGQAVPNTAPHIYNGYFLPYSKAKQGILQAAKAWKAHPRQRVENIEDPLMRGIRYLDKLIDEPAKGKAMEPRRKTCAVKGTVPIPREYRKRSKPPVQPVI